MGIYAKKNGAWQEIGVDGGSGMTWAKVSGGTVTTVTNPDGSVDEVHTFTANGTLMVESPGYARVLLVSGGSTAYQNVNPGNGGDVRDGIHSLPAGALPVVIGQPGPRGGVSSVGALRTGVAGNASNSPNAVGAGGRYDVEQGAGFTSDISGTSDDYGRAEQQAPRANRGDGSRNAAESSASAGIVIVRVQKSAPTVSGVAASGGTETTYVGDGTNGVLGQTYKVHKFTSGTANLVVTQGGEIDYLLVGGGGAAWPGSSNGEGGEIHTASAVIGPGTYPAVVGAGGSGVSGHGGDSSFLGVTAYGGYGGGAFTARGYISSSIDGTARNYGGVTTGNGTPANQGGGGGSPSGGWAGSAGVVIVRYKVAT